MTRDALRRSHGARLGWVIGAALVVAGGGCLPPASAPPTGPTRIRVDRSHLRDGSGRYVRLHGVNVSCSTKLGPLGATTSGAPSFVGRPFPLASAADHFSRLRGFGFNAIRLLVPWEAIEPHGPGQYDVEYLVYLRGLVRVAGEHGLYVLVDLHQDGFSRHLFVRFNGSPPAPPGTLEHELGALAPPYTERVQGDGAPRWAVEACLPEKRLDSPRWGTPRLSGLSESELARVAEAYAGLQALFSGRAPEDPRPWLPALSARLSPPVPPEETTDLLPLTNWALAQALSLDVARCFACFFASQEVFPTLRQDGRSVQELLQDSYARAVGRVAAELAGEPNVLGYDLMNEPSGTFLPMVALAGLRRSGGPGVETALSQWLGPDHGPRLARALMAFRVLPPDAGPESLRRYGVEGLELGAALTLTTSFEQDHLRPFYERVGSRILAEDPEALVFIEPPLALDVGGVGLGEPGRSWMQRPRGIDNLVFAPHYYADTSATFGFNQGPRRLDASQLVARDFTAALAEAAARAHGSLGNPPVVFGEFGAPMSLGGLDRAEATQHLASATLIDRLYEGLEETGFSHLQWCYSDETTRQGGDGWNREDYSLLGPGGVPRAQSAWLRPTPIALAGRPLHTRFDSDLHDFEPAKGVAPSPRVLEVAYAVRETGAATELLVPAALYPGGFQVEVTDGECAFDPQRSVLLHRPARDEPGTVHRLRLSPAGSAEHPDWDYLFRGDRVVNRRRDRQR